MSTLVIASWTTGHHEKRTGEKKRKERKGNQKRKHTQNVITKLGILQAQALELVFGIGPQSMRPGRPEARNGRADLVVVGIRIDVSGVRNLSLGRRIDAVDLGRGQLLELGDAVFLGQSVDARVAEEMNARVVDFGHFGVFLQDSLAGDLARKVFACVEIFQKGAYGGGIFGEEFNLSWLFGHDVSSCDSNLVDPMRVVARVRGCRCARARGLKKKKHLMARNHKTYAPIIDKLSTNVLKVRALLQQGLMSRQQTLRIVLSNHERHDRR